MGAVLSRARSDLRTHLRSVLLLGVVLGLFAGATVAAIAGGRRTTTAHPRFLQAADSWDLFVGDYSVFAPDIFATPDFPRIAEMPQVRRAVETTYFFGETIGVTAPADPSFGRAFARWTILEGRLPDPSSVEEVVLPFASSHRSKVRVGERSHLVLFGADQQPVEIPIRVVGIVAGPGDFPPLDLVGNDAIATPAFAARHRDRVFTTTGQYVWVRGEPRAVVRALEATAGGKIISVFDIRDQVRNVERSFDLQGIALWLLGAVLAIAVALVYAQAVARHVLLGAGENGVLRALGMRRMQLAAVGAVRVGVILALGAVVAFAVGVAASPLFPRGRAAIAEPSAGIAVDLVAFALGFVPILVVIGLALVRPLFRSSMVVTNGARDNEMLSRPSRVAAALARAGFSPAAVCGARLALEPGAGRSAVPVRSTLAATSMALVALVAAFTFEGSLRELLNNPEVIGKRWDVSYGFDEGKGPENLETARRHPDVSSAVLGSTGVPMTVDEQAGFAIAIAGEDFSILPAPLEGRYPGLDEILLAPRTARAVGKGVGDPVEIGPPGMRKHRFRISGIGILPPVAETMQLGEGVAIHYDSITRAIPHAPPPDELLVAFRSGVDAEAARERLRAQLSGVSGEHQTIQSPQDLVNLGRIDVVPRVLALLLAILGSAIVAHLLVTSVRHRRRDLSVLKTIGFVRGQILRTVAWQATLVMLVSLLVAVPVGVVTGRWVWALLATRLGVVVRPVIGVVPVLLTVAAALVLANLVALFPARAAARTQPAHVLRAE